MDERFDEGAGQSVAGRRQHTRERLHILGAEREETVAERRGVESGSCSLRPARRFAPDHHDEARGHRRDYGGCGSSRGRRRRSVEAVEKLPQSAAEAGR